ncbi:hypothetical protein SDC9_187000 [bioreactor metagenome]|uniref:Uncharacterized protein n=1 Tax=bioreactor metagenome TaxID=1076179 RepID=A0A645HM00_9ZZZZ
MERTLRETHPRLILRRKVSEAFAEEEEEQGSGSSFRRKAETDGADFAMT